MLFPILSTACLLGGTFLLLTRAMLFSVSLVIASSEPAPRTEAA